jgi:hypothetical protein
VLLSAVAIAVEGSLSPTEVSPFQLLDFRLQFQLLHSQMLKFSLVLQMLILQFNPVFLKLPTFCTRLLEKLEPPFGQHVSPFGLIYGIEDPADTLSAKLHDLFRSTSRIVARNAQAIRVSGCRNARALILLGQR